MGRGVKSLIAMRSTSARVFTIGEKRLEYTDTRMLQEKVLS